MGNHRVRRNCLFSQISQSLENKTVASLVLIPLRVTRFLTTAPARSKTSRGRDGGQEVTHDASFIFKGYKTSFGYF